MLLRASLLLNVSSDAPRNAGSQRSSSRLEAQAAFFTLPARMQAVQTRTCFLTPATTARTRFRFGFQRRRRVLFAWLITFPKCGALPQNSHFSAIFLPASVFIWAWISWSKCRKTKLLILTDPLPTAKRVLLISAGSAGYTNRGPHSSPGRLASSFAPATSPQAPVLSYGIRTRAAYQL